MKKNTKVKKTKEEIQAEKEQRWKNMRNLAKSFAKQAGIKVVKEKKTNKYDYLEHVKSKNISCYC